MKKHLGDSKQSPAMVDTTHTNASFLIRITKVEIVLSQVTWNNRQESINKRRKEASFKTKPNLKIHGTDKMEGISETTNSHLICVGDKIESSPRRQRPPTDARNLTQGHVCPHALHWASARDDDSTTVCVECFRRLPTSWTSWFSNTNNSLPDNHHHLMIVQFHAHEYPNPYTS